MRKLKYPPIVFVMPLALITMLSIYGSVVSTAVGDLSAVFTPTAPVVTKIAASRDATLPSNDLQNPRQTSDDRGEARLQSHYVRMNQGGNLDAFDLVPAPGQAASLFKNHQLSPQSS